MPNRLAIATNLNPSIIALKPRQVLLANANAAMSDSRSSSSLKADQRTLLLSSLSQYLERNGFSKTVKKLRSEAQIEKDGIKDSPPNLEEIFKKYFETRSHDKSANSLKEQAGEGATVISMESLSKKKKKSRGNDDYAAVGQSKTVDTKQTEEMTTSSIASELNGKTKERKKRKKISESLEQGTEQVSSEAHEEPTQNIVGESLLEEPNKGDKEKKKKKKQNKVSPEPLYGNGENNLELESKEISNKSKDKKKKKDKLSSDSLIKNSNNEKDDIKSDTVDVVTKESKALKKRKRLDSEENDSKLVDVKVIEESKLGKAGIEANTANGNGQVGSDEAANTPMKQLKGCDYKNLDRSVEKSAKKQRIGSAEPTTLKAFQRVKVDEVVFTDERLQDNSYWAKDGAESGYGAKAQEVLGQVRGRDFRHEKTKKKRGSYRGGQIDLQSHSVKFNYSDEE